MELFRVGLGCGHSNLLLWSIKRMLFLLVLFHFCCL